MRRFVFPSAAVMTTVRFAGRVVPPNLKLQVEANSQRQDNDLNYLMTYHITIDDAVITADCDVEDYSRDKILRMLLGAIDITQGIVDIASFRLGAHFVVYFEGFQEPHGPVVPFRTGQPELAELCTAYEIDDQSFVDIMRLVFSEPDFAFALRDLIDGTSAPRKIVPLCARSVETIRHMIRPSQTDQQRKRAWVSLQDVLNVTRAYREKITVESRGPRHGIYEAVPAELTQEIAQRAWTLMNRFIEFRKRGNNLLPLDEFPLLDG